MKVHLDEFWITSYWDYLGRGPDGVLRGNSRKFGFLGFLVVFLILIGPVFLDRTVLDLMISKKCKYALKALVRLAQEYGGGLVLTDDIAKSEHIPKKFLELILLDLKHAGYVRSKQGTKGGYRLVQHPSEISLAEIYRLFDGAIALAPCVSQKFYEECDDCPDEKNCRLKRVFVDLREKTYELLAGITIESFLDGSQPLKSASNN